jgi:hypothetical protein
MGKHSLTALVAQSKTPQASCGPSLREKVIDVSRCLSKSALSL